MPIPKIRFKSPPFPLIILLFLSFFSITTAQFTTEKNQRESTTPVLKVSPTQLAVKNLSLPLPLVNVTIENVEKLFAWEIKLYFNSKILNITEKDVWYPENHVFANKKFFKVSPKISHKESFIHFGASLLGEDSFTGSGILCQINFSSIFTGVSSLNFSTPIGVDTFLLDSNLNIITMQVIDAKPSGTITLQTDRIAIQTGLTFSITGTLTPKKKDAQINIYYKTHEVPIWIKMVSVKTNIEGHFFYTWKPPAAGTYEIFAEWKGNEKTNPAISPTQTVSVQKPSASLLPRLALGTFILILAMLIILLVWREKQITSPKEENTIKD